MPTIKNKPQEIGDCFSDEETQRDVAGSKVHPPWLQAPPRQETSSLLRLRLVWQLHGENC